MKLKKLAFGVFFSVLFLNLSLCLCGAEPIRVAIYQDKGVARKAPPLLMEILSEDPAFEAKCVSGQDIRDGILEQFDLILLPGGSGRGEAASMQPEGVEKVKEFVRSGKGYLGICAGAYFPIQQGFMNAETKSPKWVRGQAMLEIELTEAGLEVFGEEFKGTQIVRYHNGPIIHVNVDPNGPEVEVLSWFRTETSKGDAPVGIQVNSPAMVRTTYGDGHIVTFSPHPESSGSETLKLFVPRALRYLYLKNQQSN